MNTRDARIVMTRELTEISVTRKQLVKTMVDTMLNNFTNSELCQIAECMRIGNTGRLLQLIQR